MSSLAQVSTVIRLTARLVLAASCMGIISCDDETVAHDYPASPVYQYQAEAVTLIVDGALTNEQAGHFRNLASALAHAQPGTTILVKKGTYHESVTVDKAGITIAAFDPKRPPVIDGADPAFVDPVWTHMYGKIYKTRYRWYKEQPTAEAFNNYGGGKSPEGIALQVYEDGVLLRGYRGGWSDKWTRGVGGPYTSLTQLYPTSSMYYPLPSTKPEIRIPGRFMYNEFTGELYVWSAAEDSPDQHSYAIPVLQNLIRIQAAGVTLRHLVLKNSAGFAVTVEDGADGTRVQNCYLVGNMYAIFVRDADDVTIAHNFVQQKGMWERYWYYDCKDTILYSHAIDLHPGEGGRAEVYGNVVHGNYSAILARSHTRVHGNLLSNCMSTHVNMGPESVDLWIYRNVLHHVDDNAIGTANLDGGPIWVFRNLFYRCRALNKAGTSMSDDMYAECYFYHNTLAFAELIVNHPYVYPVYRGHVYRNNIFHLRYLGTHEHYWKYVNKDLSLGWNFFPFQQGPDTDYNLHWEVDATDGTEGVAFFSYAGDPAGDHQFDSFDRFQAQTGLDPHGLEADPLFHLTLTSDNVETLVADYDTVSDMNYIDVAETGLAPLLEVQFDRFADLFGLDEESPARDRGTTLPSDWPDVVEIGDNAPDMGAWEVQ